MPIEPIALREILNAASAIAMTHFEQTLHVEIKEDGSPATAADRKINAFLESSLRDLFPAAQWLSEETADTEERLGAEWTWVVDPLDGTKEFVRGVREFGISVGLVRGDRVVAGAVVNPATGEGGIAIEGHAPDFWGMAGPGSPAPRLETAGALVSRSEAARGEIAPYEALFAAVRPVGSVAYKLLLVAAGAGDLTFSVQPKHEWDICGGVGLVEAAGLTYRRFDGGENLFNQIRPLVNTGAIAARGELVGEFLEAWASIRPGGPVRNRRTDSRE